MHDTVLVIASPSPHHHHPSPTGEAEPAGDVTERRQLAEGGALTEGDGQDTR